MKLRVRSKGRKNISRVESLLSRAKGNNTMHRRQIRWLTKTILFLSVSIVAVATVGCV
ncbi:MAG: hypothetical protein MI923_13135 [Phycisphaerales bacterium]|nr:hypothetical protein [Phycisphaerales bacterium]